MSKDRGVYEKRPGSGVWYIRYAADGEIRRERAGTRTQARNLLAVRRVEVMEGRLPARRPKPVTLKRFLEETYLPSIEGTHRDYPEIKLRAAKWVEELGRKRLAAITPADIEKYRSKLLKAGRAPATCNRYLALIRRILTVALENDLIDRNPASKVKAQKENNARDRFLSEEEEKRLFEDLSALEGAHISLALHTGLRREEQFGLRQTQIDWGARRLTIPRSKHGEKRYVLLNKSAYWALRELERQGWLDAHPRMNGPNFVRRRFKPALERAGIKNLRWHDLRHTFGSRLAQRGCNPQTIRELMGHKSIEMTYRYMHLAPGGLHDAVNLLDAPRSGPKTDPDQIRVRRKAEKRSAPGVTRTRDTRIRKPRDKRL